MSSMATFILAMMAGLAVGALFGTQASVNGMLGASVRQPLQASLISFVIGTVLLIVLTAVLGQFPPQFRVSSNQLPWWTWTGGVIGVIVVTASLIFVPRIGSLAWLATVITGQIAAGLLLDHFGLLGNPRISISPLRFLGLALLFAGVLVIIQARRLENKQGLLEDSAVTSAVLGSPPSRPTD
jgi:transporter family-2 protein